MIQPSSSSSGNATSSAPAAARPATRPSPHPASQVKTAIVLSKTAADHLLVELDGQKARVEIDGPLPARSPKSVRLTLFNDRIASNPALGATPSTARTGTPGATQIIQVQVTALDDVTLDPPKLARMFPLAGPQDPVEISTQNKAFSASLQLDHISKPLKAHIVLSPPESASATLSNHQLPSAGQSTTQQHARVRRLTARPSETAANANAGGARQTVQLATSTPLPSLGKSGDIQRPGGTSRIAFASSATQDDAAIVSHSNTAQTASFRKQTAQILFELFNSPAQFTVADGEEYAGITLRNDHLTVQIAENLPGLSTGDQVTGRLQPSDATLSKSDFIGKLLSQLFPESGEKAQSQVPQPGKLGEIITRQIADGTVQSADDGNMLRGRVNLQDLAARSDSASSRPIAATPPAAMNDAATQHHLRTTEVPNQITYRNLTELEWLIDQERDQGGGKGKSGGKTCTIKLEFSALGRVDIKLSHARHALTARVETDGILDETVRAEISGLFAAGSELTGQIGHLVMRFGRPPPVRT